MSDLYEEPIQGGDMDEDLYENPVEEQRQQQQRFNAPFPAPPGSSSKTLPPKKPVRSVTTVVGDHNVIEQEQTNAGKGQWDIKLRNTGKLDEARQQHRMSLGRQAQPPQKPPPQSQRTPPSQNRTQPAGSWQQHPAQSASNARPPEEQSSLDPAGKKAGTVAGGFRLPAASFMSANKPKLRKTPSGVQDSNFPQKPVLSPTEPKPAMLSAPEARPATKAKPSLAAKPQPSPNKPSPTMNRGPPPKAQKPPPPGNSPKPTAHNGTSLEISASVPPQGSPRTPTTPTPAQATTTLASRFRRVPPRMGDLGPPPPVPTSTKPRLPPEGVKLSTQKPPTPKISLPPESKPESKPVLANGPLRLPPSSIKTGNSPLPPRPAKPAESPTPQLPTKPAESPTPPRPVKPAESPTPPRPPKDVSDPKLIPLRRSTSFKTEPRRSPPKTMPPPPPPGEEDDESDNFDEVAEEEDLYEAAMDETPRSTSAIVDGDDLDDDIDSVLDSIGSAPPPQPTAAPPPVTPPPPAAAFIQPTIADEDDVIGEDLYDDAEGVAEAIRQSKSQLPGADDPVYEVENSTDSLPPPCEDLYDDIPGGAEGIVEVVEEEQYNEVMGERSGGSVSDFVSDEWSQDETLDGDPAPLRQDSNGQALPEKKRKLSKRTKKRVKEEEKQRQINEKKAKEEEERQRIINEKKAKEDAKRREKEDKELAKQREKEAKENKRKEAERVKLVEKQRKHHKVAPDRKPQFVATARQEVNKGPNHYLLFSQGERFNVLYSEPDKQHKLPKSVWIVERQLDGQVGLASSALMTVDDVVEEIECESMYEDVGQGSAVAAAAMSPASRMSAMSMPPPSVKAPPVPGIIAPSAADEEEECLYEDLPN